MLDDLDAIDWTTLHGAYGPAGEVPGLIRGLASRDDEQAANARGRLEGWVSHQGTTYSASPPVVRFLAGLLLDGATRQRGGLARMLGGMAAHTNQRTKHLGAVRAAVEAEVDRLTPLLEDPDPQVRDGVAFVLSQCPKSRRRTLPALRARFAAEPEPQLRARLLAGIQWLDKQTPLLTAALGAEQPPAVRAAAALTLARSDRPWTPAATDAVRDAWAGGEPLESCWWWGWESSPVQDLIAGLGGKGPDGAAVLGLLLTSSTGAARPPDAASSTDTALSADAKRAEGDAGRAEGDAGRAEGDAGRAEGDAGRAEGDAGRAEGDAVREEAAAATVFVVRAERQARALLVPMLEQALADPSAAVRRDVTRALSEAGAAARPAADALAAAATPGALGALVRLGDERWPALAATLLRGGTGVEGVLEALHEARIPFDPGVMDAITTTDPDDWHRWGIYLLAAWGPAAAPAVPQLATLLDTNLRDWALDALTAIGPAAAPVLPRLRAAPGLGGPPVVKENGNVRVTGVAERIAVLRIGADPGPALDAARAALAALRGRPSGGWHDLPHDDAVRLLDALGEQGRSLRPEVLDLVTTRPDLIGLARALWRWSADAAEVRPTVQTVLEHAAAQLRQRTPQYPGLPAVELAAELGDASLAPLLRPFLADPTSRTRVPAAAAIWRLTGDADGLTGPLLKEVSGRPPGFRWQAALELLAELGPAAIDALDDLRALAGHPWCPFADDFDSRRNHWLGHRDDTFLAATHAAITAIAATP